MQKHLSLSSLIDSIPTHEDLLTAPGAMRNLGILQQSGGVSPPQLPGAWCSPATYSLQYTHTGLVANPGPHGQVGKQHAKQRQFGREIHIVFPYLGMKTICSKMFAGRDSLLLIRVLHSQPSLPVTNDLRWERPRLLERIVLMETWFLNLRSLKTFWRISHSRSLCDKLIPWGEYSLYSMWSRKGALTPANPSHFPCVSLSTRSL